MAIGMRLRRWKFRILARAAWKRLAALRGEKLRARGERVALRTFHAAAERVPAYREILREVGVEPSRIATADDFRRDVPLTDKETVFLRFPVDRLCWDGSAAGAACVYTSSGYSGTFSLGLETHHQAARGRDNLDLLLEMYLQASRTPTLVVNALPMGVQVPCTLGIKLDTSVRSDAGVAVLRAMRDVCPQTLILGEHPFLKKVVEDGLNAGVDWPAHRVTLVTGAENMPESYRAYIGEILGHDARDPRTGRIMVSTGISEVGLTIGHETDDCRRIRRSAAGDAALRDALFPDAPFLPSFVQYLPDMYHLETVADEGGLPRLVVTTCSRDRMIPLIRYATGDWAEVLSHAEVSLRLSRAGRKDLLPRFEMPFLCLWGRGRGVEIAGGATVYPEQVKEALYAEADLARTVTANFRMAADEGGAGLHLRFQLKPETAGGGDLPGRFERHFSEQLGAACRVELTPYKQFTEALELCYQRKFRYLG